VTPSGLRAKIVAERVAWVRKMLVGMRALPQLTVEGVRAALAYAAEALRRDVILPLAG
jgi:hypothetical protein